MAKKKVSHEPCPFCGNSMQLKSDLLLGSNRHYSVRCSDCGCYGPIAEEWDGKKNGDSKAFILWNKRKQTFKL